MHPGGRGESRQATSRVPLLLPWPQDTKCQGENAGTNHLIQVEDFWSIGEQGQVKTRRFKSGTRTLELEMSRDRICARLRELELGSYHHAVKGA